MEKIDVRGLSCPLPVIKVKKAIDNGAVEVQVLGNSNVSRENVSKLLNSQGFSLDLTRSDHEGWELEARKNQ